MPSDVTAMSDKPHTEPSELAMRLATKVYGQIGNARRNYAGAIDRSIADLQAECDALKAIVDKLPKFKDGVTANNLDPAWFNPGYGTTPAQGIVIYHVGWGNQYEPIVNCYSTEAAALAAQEASDA